MGSRKENISVCKRITGDRLLFTMENRLFTLVVAITSFILFCYLIFDLFIGQNIMSAVIVLLLGLLGLLYYYSRFKQQYKKGIVVYALFCYPALAMNYFNNGGIIGPTLLVFCLTFQLLIAMSPRKLYKLWICLHLFFAFGLLASEYLHPEWVPKTYPGRLSNFMDIGFTYLSVIFFVYYITDCLRDYYNDEKLKAEERELAISVQNEKIIKQNSELEKLNEEKNKLFSIVSHDLRAPIDSIRGYLEMITEHELTPEEKAEFEGELLTQTKYTTDLLMNLLYWSKAQMSGVKAKLTPLSLRAMVDDARNYKNCLSASVELNLRYARKLSERFPGVSCTVQN